MEQFSIIVDEVQYTITPIEGGSYGILEGNQGLGHIFSKDEPGGVKWYSDEDLDPELVKKIGELIALYHL